MPIVNPIYGGLVHNVYRGQPLTNNIVHNQTTANTSFENGSIILHDLNYSIYPTEMVKTEVEHDNSVDWID